MALRPTPTIDEKAAELRLNDLDHLAPKFRLAVDHAVEQCRMKGHPVVVFETLRTNELAKLYYSAGRSKAKDGRKTWHFYGLAVDLIHPEHGWRWWELSAMGLADAVKAGFKEEEWHRACTWRDTVVSTFEHYGCDWGGHWVSFKDWPHFQWGKCGPTPDHAPTIYDNHGGELAGRQAVWAAVGAQ